MGDIQWGSGHHLGHFFGLHPNIVWYPCDDVTSLAFKNIIKQINLPTKCIGLATLCFSIGNFILPCKSSQFYLLLLSFLEGKKKQCSHKLTKLNIFPVS